MLAISQTIILQNNTHIKLKAHVVSETFPFHVEINWSHQI